MTNHTSSRSRPMLYVSALQKEQRDGMVAVLAPER